MSGKKCAKMLNLHQVIVILIIFITDFSTEKLNILYNFGFTNYKENIFIICVFEF